MKLSLWQSACHHMTIDQRFSALDDALSTQDSDLFMVPELFFTGYNIGDETPKMAQPINGPIHQSLIKLARKHNTALLGTWVEHSKSTLFNTATLISSSGETLAHHRKNAIPPGPERDYFKPHLNKTLFKLNEFTCAILICHDVEFPELTRALARAGADLILVPTALNDSWPIVADHLIPTRAFENGTYVAYANHAGTENGLTYYGHSCICSPTGGQLARADHSPQILTATLNRTAVTDAQTRLPYLPDSAPFV